MEHQPHDDAASVVMALPGEEAAAQLADTVPLLVEVRELVEVLGDKGRELTDTGWFAERDHAELAAHVGVDPGDPDGAGDGDLPGLRELVDVALEAGFVRRHRGRLVPVMSRRAMLLDDPDDAWSRLAETLLAVGPLALSGRTDRGDVTRALDGEAAALLESLYHVGPLPAGSVVDRVRAALLGGAWGVPADDAEPARVRGGLATQLSTLAHGGVIGWQPDPAVNGATAARARADDDSDDDSRDAEVSCPLCVDAGGRWQVGAAPPARSLCAGRTEETRTALDPDSDAVVCRTLALTPLGLGLVHRRLASDADPPVPAG